MAIYEFRTKTYANAIFVFGTNRLTARDGYPGVAPDYYTPVEQYAAANYTQEQIEVALASGWINEQEYQEVMSYRVV